MCVFVFDTNTFVLHVETHSSDDRLRELAFNLNLESSKRTKVVVTNDVGDGGDDDNVATTGLKLVQYHYNLHIVQFLLRQHSYTILHIIAHPCDSMLRWFEWIDFGIVRMDPLELATIDYAV